MQHPTPMKGRPLGQIEYNWLGRILARMRPDVAKELIDDYYSEDVKPQETDLSKVTHFFILYCTIEGIDPVHLRGNQRKTAGTDMRRYFIATMLHLYRPKFFIYPYGIKRSNDGLTSTLADVLEVTPVVVSKAIAQLGVWVKCDEEFSERVRAIVSHLKGGEN